MTWAEATFSPEYRERLRKIKEQREAEDEATRMDVTIGVISGRHFNLSLSSRERYNLLSDQGQWFTSGDLTINKTHIESVVIHR